MSLAHGSKASEALAPRTQELPEGQALKGTPAPPLWMTTVSSHEPRGVLHALAFSTSRILREEACGTVVCTESSFGWRCSVFSGCRSLRGRSTPPSPGAPPTPHPQQDVPAQTWPPFPGADAVSVRHHCGSG